MDRIRHIIDDSNERMTSQDFVLATRQSRMQLIVLVYWRNKKPTEEDVDHQMQR